MRKKTAFAVVVFLMTFSAFSAFASGISSIPELSFAKPFQGLMQGGRPSGSYSPNDGVESYDGISSVLYYKDQVMPSRYVTALTSNKRGDVYVGTKDAGVFRFSIDSSKRHWFNKFPVKDKAVAVHDLCYDEKNRAFFVATTAGVFKIDDESDLQSATCKLMDKFPETLCLCLALDKNNGLWVGTPNGVYDPSGTFFGTKDGLPSAMVTSLQTDKNGNMWIGTDGGLVRKSANTFRDVDFGDSEKRWVTAMDREQPLQLFIPLEKYQLIGEAFFAGIRKNSEYDGAKKEIDAQMNKLLHVEKQGSDDVLVATTNGLFKVDINSLEATLIEPGWFNAICFANTGQFFAMDNEMQMKNFSPTKRLLARFDLGRRLISRLVAKIKLEVTGEAEPDFLDEKTIHELQGLGDEDLYKELLPYVENLKVTAMHFDKDGRMWVAVDGGGLFYFVGRLNTANFFVRPLGQKRRYFLQSQINEVPENSDLVQGEASFRNAFKEKYNFLPLKTMIAQTSDIYDEDWQRIGRYAGEKINPNDCIQFLGLLAVNPWHFIPCIHYGDIPAFKKTIDGFADLSEESIDQHETFVLPVYTNKSGDRIETYPADHPLSRVSNRSNRQNR